MIGALIGIIVAVIVLGVVFWAIQMLMPLVPLGEPFQTIVRVLLIVLTVIVVLWVCIQLLDVAGIYVPFGHR